MKSWIHCIAQNITQQNHNFIVQQIFLHKIQLCINCANGVVIPLCYIMHCTTEFWFYCVTKPIAQMNCDSIERQQNRKNRIVISLCIMESWFIFDYENERKKKLTTCECKEWRKGKRKKGRMNEQREKRREEWR